MVTFLMIVLGIVTVLLGLAILIQEPKQAGLSGAFGLGGSEQMLGTSATSGIARFTMYLSVAFFLLCITVGLLAREGRDDSRLKSDPVENAIGSLEPVPIGIGDALGGNEPVTSGAAADGIAVDGVAVDGEGVVDAGAADDGAADDGAADDGAAGDGAAGDGAADDGAADDGAADDGAADDGAADDGAAGDANSSGTSTDDGGSGN
ncbi:MAG: preprotein translocase subunit SecG [Planctomycetota bacterium]|nr:preprotein translocase subunit SecG [Planctomycetota bacterium]